MKNFMYKLSNRGKAGLVDRLVSFYKMIEDSTVVWIKKHYERLDNEI